jgi:hypothetical protein
MCSVLGDSADIKRYGLTEQALQSDRVPSPQPELRRWQTEGAVHTVLRPFPRTALEGIRMEF